MACRNNGGAIHLSGEMGSSSLSSLKPIQILRAQNIRCNMNTVFLKIIYTCILTVKGKIQRFTVKNRRSLSGSRRARNNFSGSFQNTLLKIMKTEELSVFGNYLLFICFTIPDVVNKCLKAALRLYNFLWGRPTDRALYFQVVCCLPWCQRKFVARAKRISLTVSFSSFARKAFFLYMYCSIYN